MIISYLPPKKIHFGRAILEFDEKRELVRDTLGMNYTENNEVMRVGDVKIYQRRDVYKNLYSAHNFFFLGYDQSDLLSEIEVHDCAKIKVNGIEFGFDDDLGSIAFQLSHYFSISRQSEGEYFFKEIGVVIMDKNRMGGKGSSLGYFYCALDVTHLE